MKSRHPEPAPASGRSPSAPPHPQRALLAQRRRHQLARESARQVREYLQGGTRAGD